MTTKKTKPHTRNNPPKLITLPPETWSRLDEIAKRLGESRSATIGKLVTDAKLPRDRA